MYINRINNQTTFGYNKEVNTELRNKLKNDNQHQSEKIQDLMILQGYSMNIEDQLRSAEKEDEEAKKNNLFVLFSTIKKTLAEQVEKFYPELHFAQREAAEYIKEDMSLMDKPNYNFDKSSWQFTIADELVGIANNKNNQNGAVKKTEQAEDTEETEEPETKAKALQMPSVIEKFVPTYSSPKGFVSIGGMSELKEELYDKIIFPVQNPEEAERDLVEYGKRAPRGILFYGPPGCGKTMTAEAVSAESKMPLFKLKISKAGSEYINQTSKNYQKAFDYVEYYSKMLAMPCIMLIDEVDGITKGRDGKSSGEDLKQMSTLLNLIEGARDKNIIVIGTTNKYDIVDEAIRRRFDEQVYIGMPDKTTRKEILKNTLSQWQKGIALAQNDEELEIIADKTKSFPSSALVILSDKASNSARKDGRREIRIEDFVEEIAKNQNLKIKEEQYKNNAERATIGFNI